MRLFKHVRLLRPRHLDSLGRPRSRVAELVRAYENRGFPKLVASNPSSQAPSVVWQPNALPEMDSSELRNRTRSHHVTYTDVE